MVRYLIFAFLIFCGCQKTSKDLCSHFEGWKMTMPYHIVVGKHLSNREKKEVAKAIEETFQTVDAIFNNWNPQSEISRFNATDAHVPFSLSPQLCELFLFCQKMVSLSGGRFDPAIYPLIQAWRSSLKEQKPPSHEELQTACDASGWDHLSLKKNSLTKDCAQTTLDLCSVSKGLCIDWIVEKLQAMGYPDLFVEWAGEIRAAGIHPEGRSWIVQIDPGLLMEGQPIAPIALKNAAIATSGDAGQKGWILAPHSAPDGRLHRFFHILDPLTAQPLEKTDYSVASVSVIAPTCLLADALATTAMIFPGKKEAENWAQEVAALYPDVSFWILCYDPTRRFP